MAIGALNGHVPLVQSYSSFGLITLPCATDGTEHEATKCFLND